MHSFYNLLFSGALYATTCSAVNLYIAASDGNLTTLSLTQSNSTYELKVASITKDYGPNASWLNLDSSNRVIYCLDRGASSAINGSMNSFTIGDAGEMSLIDRVPIPASGVSAEIFGTEGNRGIISASYNSSAIAVMGIDDGGAIGQLSQSLQNISPTLTRLGPVTSRQDKSYLHQVLLDPEEKHIVMSDLGGDMFRVFNWDAENLAPLTELAALETENGVGPRHGVFWKSSPESTENFLFFVGELDQKVHSYKVNITDDGITWTKFFEISALGVDNEKPATTAPPSEIAITPDNKFLIVSNRDISFRDSTQYKSGPSDTMSTFTINDNGTLSLVQLAPSGGYSPRQFSINKAGDLIAVGHQSNKTVVIWERDIVSGKIITEAEGGPAAVITLTGAVVCALWDE